MGTPESELESKYFIEGDAHARGGKKKEFRFVELLCAAAMQLAARGSPVLHKKSVPNKPAGYLFQNPIDSAIISRLGA